MSIKGAGEEQARCFKYWPTGKECVTFYFLLLLTLLAIVASLAILVFVPVLSCGAQSFFQGLITTCVAFWLRSPVDYFK